MTNENRQKWMDALRSGEYEQGTGRLFDYPTNKYCCIGVYAKAVLGATFDATGSNTLEDYGGDSWYPFLQEHLPDGMKVDEFVRMNDIKGNSFKQIADFIEENV